MGPGKGMTPMFGTRMRAILLTAFLLLPLAALCSCDQLIVEELPTETRLRDDVESYFKDLAGNEVQLFEMKIDERDYQEQEGRATYGCTVRFAWDAFNGENTNKLEASYALVDGSWTISSIHTDIDPESLQDRVLMRGLYEKAVDVPAVVLAAFAGQYDALSDSLLDYSIRLIDAVYRFPCPMQQFTLNGWAPSPEQDITLKSTLAAQTYVTVPMVREGGGTILLYVANRTDQILMAGACECIGVTVRSDECQAATAAEVALPSTPEAVYAAYGEATLQETKTEGTQWIYQDAAGGRTTFLFAGEYTQADLFTQGWEAAQAEPAALFDTYDFSFSLDGEEYTLPARLETFLNNGWALTGADTPEDVLSWYATKTVTLQRGEESVTAVLRSPSMGDLRLYAASVAAVTLDGSQGNVTLITTDAAGARTALPLTPPADGLVAGLGTPTESKTEDGTQTDSYTGDADRLVTVTRTETDVLVYLQALSVDTSSETLNTMAFSITLGTNVFAVPDAAADFQEKMWVPEYGWEQRVQANSFVKTRVENRRTESMTAYVINTGTETAAMNACQIAGLYAGAGDIDMVVGNSLHKGSAAGEILDTFGTPDYDILDGDARYLVYGSSINHFLCVQCNQDTVTALWSISLANP